MVFKVKTPKRTLNIKNANGDSMGNKCRGKEDCKEYLICTDCEGVWTCQCWNGVEGRCEKPKKKKVKIFRIIK